MSTVFLHRNKLSGSQYPDADFLWTNLFLSCWTNDDTDFPKVIRIISPLSCHLKFSIVVLETLKLEWLHSQYHELSPAYNKCGTSVACDIVCVSRQGKMPIVKQNQEQMLENRSVKWKFVVRIHWNSWVKLRCLKMCQSL